MFCKKCGSKIPDDSIFCMFCGEKVVIPEEEAKTVSSEEMIEEETEASVQNPAEEQVELDKPDQVIIELGEDKAIHLDKMKYRFGFYDTRFKDYAKQTTDEFCEELFAKYTTTQETLDHMRYDTAHYVFPKAFKIAVEYLQAVGISDVNTDDIYHLMQERRYFGPLVNETKTYMDRCKGLDRDLESYGAELDGTPSHRYDDETPLFADDIDVLGYDLGRMAYNGLSAVGHFTKNSIKKRMRADEHEAVKNVWLEQVRGAIRLGLYRTLRNVGKATMLVMQQYGKGQYMSKDRLNDWYHTPIDDDDVYKAEEAVKRASADETSTEEKINLLIYAIETDPENKDAYVSLLPLTEDPTGILRTLAVEMNAPIDEGC